MQRSTKLPSRRQLGAPLVAVALAALGCAIANVPTSAHANDEDLPPKDDGADVVGPGAAWAARPIALHGHFSLGGPVGWIGAAVELSPVPFVGLSLGGGAAPFGPQVSASALFRAPVARTSAIGFEFGGSLDFDTMGVGTSSDGWINVATFYELRTMGGFSFRPYVGWGHRVDDRNRCRTGCEDITDEPDIFFAGLAVGYAFET